MTSEERIDAFCRLGDKIRSFSSSDLAEISSKASIENRWFTRENVERALHGIGFMLEKSQLSKWLAPYSLKVERPKVVGLVMAGNIPLVGFHDLMTILLSGHFAAIKTSSDDSFLPKAVVDWLLELEPRFKKNIEFRERLKDIEAVIATGSDNTSRYFEYYFRNIPNIIRKNRTSIAILDGSETSDQLRELGKDIFWYFGLGCRNVSKLLIPKDYNPEKFFQSVQIFENIIDHNKYKNNYDYHKSIFLVDSVKHLDNGFLLWVNSEKLVSPLSTIYVQEFDDELTRNNYIKSNVDKIQCIVGENHIPFGKAQMPEPWDYADKVDTMEFLMSI